MSPTLPHTWSLYRGGLIPAPFSCLQDWVYRYGYPGSLELCYRSFYLPNSILGWVWKHYRKAYHHYDLRHDTLPWSRWSPDDCITLVLRWSNSIRILSASLFHVCLCANCSCSPINTSRDSARACSSMATSFFRWRLIDSWILTLHVISFWLLCSYLRWNRRLWNKNTWDHFFQRSSSLSYNLLCLCCCL
jgi:hypothetical protein